MRLLDDPAGDGAEIAMAAVSFGVSGHHQQLVAAGQIGQDGFRLPGEHQLVDGHIGVAVAVAGELLGELDAEAVRPVSSSRSSGGRYVGPSGPRP